MDTADSQIDARIRAQDARGALALIAGSYGAMLGRFCAAQVGSLGDGEEALQETLVRAYDGLGSYRGEAGVRAWLFGIARHVCSDLLRKRGRRDVAFGRYAVAEGTNATQAAEARMALEGALAGLSPNLREAVLLRYQLGMDATEVADALHISHAAARKRISLGIAALRAALDAAPVRPARAHVAAAAANTDSLVPSDKGDADDHALRTSENPAVLGS